MSRVDPCLGEIFICYVGVFIPPQRKHRGPITVVRGLVLYFLSTAGEPGDTATPCTTKLRAEQFRRRSSTHDIQHLPLPHLSQPRET